MRKWLPPVVWIALLLVFLSSSNARAQSIENFRWLDLRQASDVQTIVARALMNEPYTMLRDVIFSHPTMAEGLGPLLTTVPA